MAESLIAKLGRLKKAVSDAKAALEAAQAALDTYAGGRYIGEAAERGTRLARAVVDAEKALAAAEAAVVTTEAEIAAAAAAREAQRAAAREAAKKAAQEASKQTVRRGVIRTVITAIAEWLGISTAAVIAGTVVAVLVIGGVIYVVSRDSETGVAETVATETIPTGTTEETDTTGPPGDDVIANGQFTFAKIGEARVSSNKVTINFPAAGGDVGPGSEGELKLDDVPFGKIVYAIAQGLACSVASIPGVSPGQGDDCNPDQFPEEFARCKGSMEMTVKFEGRYDASARTATGPAQIKLGIGIPDNCPKDVQSFKGTGFKTGTWTGTLSGNTLKGSIKADDDTIAFEATN